LCGQKHARRVNPVKSEIFAGTQKPPKGPFLAQFETDELAETTTGSQNTLCAMVRLLGSDERFLIEKYQSLQLQRDWKEKHRQS
jgi:hypothetical protein